MKRSITAALMLALSLGAAVAPASARDSNARHKAEIQYSDLNLTSAAGQAALEARIDRAAKKACGYGTRPTGSRIQRQAVVRCYKAAKESAKTQMSALVDKSRLGG